MGPLPGSGAAQVTVAARGPQSAQLLAHGGRVLAASAALVGDHLTLTLPVKTLVPLTHIPLPVCLIPQPPAGTRERDMSPLPL